MTRTSPDKASFWLASEQTCHEWVTCLSRQDSRIFDVSSIEKYIQCFRCFWAGFRDSSSCFPFTSDWFAGQNEAVTPHRMRTRQRTRKYKLVLREHFSTVARPHGYCENYAHSIFDASAVKTPSKRGWKFVQVDTKSTIPRGCKEHMPERFCFGTRCLKPWWFFIQILKGITSAYKNAGVDTMRLRRLGIKSRSDCNRRFGLEYCTPQMKHRHVPLPK